MRIHFFGVAALPALLLISACDRSGYETRPVPIKTAAGEVVCQLYTPDRVLWDKAVVYPNTMTRETADAYCLQEGERRKAALQAQNGKTEKTGLARLFGGAETPEKES